MRLILPGFLISLGAGQVIPYLNLFVQRKFGLDLESLNAVFALTSLGTTLAILFQPALARRVGKIGSVVLVQGVSIPFLAVLGFSPILWTVIGSMAIRNSLMNAGNPIFNAFAMERLPPRERATYAAAASVAWSLGWVIAGPWYSLLQATLGFTPGYAINFVTIIILYTLGTFLTWCVVPRAESGSVGHARRSERLSDTVPARGPAAARTCHTMARACLTADVRPRRSARGAADRLSSAAWPSPRPPPRSPASPATRDAATWG